MPTEVSGPQPSDVMMSPAFVTGIYDMDSAEQEAMEIKSASKDFVTVLGKENPVLTEHSTPFEKVYSLVSDQLEGRFRQKGYHSWKKHDVNEPAFESSHAIEHAKAGVARLSALRKIFFDHPEGDLNDLILKVVGSKKVSGEISAKQLGVMRAMFCNPETFQSLIEDQILISMVHDAAEVEGRENHEDRAKVFMCELADRYPDRFGHLSRSFYNVVSDTGQQTEISRLDYVLLGIDGSKVSTEIPPQDYEEDLLVEDRRENELHAIPKASANSMLGRLVRAVTETSDWERVSAPEHWNREYLDPNLDQTPTHLRSALEVNPNLTLAAEALIENRYHYIHGSPPSDNISKLGGLIPMIRGGRGFFNGVIMPKVSAIDQWIDAADLDANLGKRLNLHTEEANTAREEYWRKMDESGSDLLVRRTYQSAIILLTGGEVNNKVLSRLETSALKLLFERAKTREEKKKICERINTLVAGDAESVIFYSGRSRAIVKALVLSDRLDFPTPDSEQISRCDLSPKAMGKHRARYIMVGKSVEDLRPEEGRIKQGRLELHAAAQRLPEESRPNDKTIAQLAEADESRAETLEIFVMPPAKLVGELLDPYPTIFRDREVVVGMNGYDVINLILDTADEDFEVARPTILDKTLSDLTAKERKIIGDTAMEKALELQGEIEELTISDLILKYHPELATKPLFNKEEKLPQ